jgi:predicted TPR repeat methyltransferase
MSSWDEYAENWDKDESAIAYAVEAYKSLTSVVNLENMAILDFGCGTGLLTEKLSSAADHIVALDSSAKMITVLKGKNLPNVTVIAELLSATVVKEHHSLRDGFNLIVASSVCGFLPEYETTLGLLTSLLVPSGILVQWDWWSQDKQSDFGLSEERVSSAYKKAGLTTVSLTQPFTMSSGKGANPVLMGVAKNA